MKAGGKPLRGAAIRLQGREVCGKWLPSLVLGRAQPKTHINETDYDAARASEARLLHGSAFFVDTACRIGKGAS